MDSRSCIKPAQGRCFGPGRGFWYCPLGPAPTGHAGIENEMNGVRAQHHHLLPVASLLLTASLWGIVWYPLRLLEAAGLHGLWSTLVSYGTLLCLFAWIFVRYRRLLAIHFPALFLLGLAAGWCNVAFIMAVLDGTVVRVLLLFYLSPFWAVCLGWLMLDERMDGKTLLVFLLAVGGDFDPLAVNP